MHNNGLSRTSTKNGTWIISTVGAQFALWVHEAAAQQESPPLFRTGSGARHRRGTVGTCHCMVTRTSKPKNCTRKSPPSPAPTATTLPPHAHDQRKHAEEPLHTAHRTSACRRTSPQTRFVQRRRAEEHQTRPSGQQRRRLPTSFESQQRRRM